MNLFLFCLETDKKIVIREYLGSRLFGKPTKSIVAVEDIDDFDSYISNLKNDLFGFGASNCVIVLSKESYIDKKNRFIWVDTLWALYRPEEFIYGLDSDDNDFTAIEILSDSICESKILDVPKHISDYLRRVEFDLEFVKLVESEDISDFYEN